MSYQPGQKPDGVPAQPDAPTLGGAQSPEDFPTLGGRYQALRELGRGAMGRVFAAHDLKLDRDVAIKILPPGEHDERALLRFEQEGRAAAALNHPNVLDIHDVGTHQGTPYIVSELLQGETLRQRLRRGPLPPALAVDLCLQLAQGLAAAHAKGVIHRDLKPDNLFVTEEGRLKILDFGIAKLLAPGRSESLPAPRTETGTVVGTADYMAPEQVRGRPVDIRADIFSLGSILYEMLSGRRAFKGASLVETGYSILNSEPPALAADVPVELDRILRRCLQKDPQNRFQSAREVAAALEQVRSALVPAARRPRRGRAALAAAAVLAGLAALIAAKLLPRGEHVAPAAEPKPVTLLIADFKNATGDAVFDGTLEPILTIAMEGAPFINAYKRQDARRIAAELKREAGGLDEAAARLVAVREGIGVVLSGSIERSGGGYRVAVRAVEPLDGKLVAAGQADVRGKEDVLPLLGKLAAVVRGALGDTTPEMIRSGTVETFTAASIEAAHEYAAAQELQHRGDAEGAVAGYRKALELDPNLGRAYAGLAAASMNLHQPEQAEKYFQLAMAKIDRMTDRERYRTRGLYYLFLRDYEKAAEEFTGLVKRYPADIVGFLNLAVAHCYRRDMAAALDAGSRALRLAPGHLMNRSNLAIYALYSGDFEAAGREARAILQIRPNYLYPRLVVALSEMGAGRPAQAAEAYQALASLGPAAATLSAQGLADVALYEGRISDAVAILEHRIAVDAKDNPSAMARELVTLASAELARGRKGAAATAADRAVAVSKADAIAFLAASTYLLAGNERKARTLQADLAGRRTREPQAYAKILEGEAQLRHSDARGAVSTLREAQQLLDTWIGRFTLGRAYLELGAFPEAHEEFELCLKRRGEATAVFVDEVPSYRFFPPVHYYLGRAQEGLKSPAATASYRAFLAIKEKAEPGTDPLVDDARRRLGLR